MKPKFDIGDRFYVIENANTGTVESIKTTYDMHAIPVVTYSVKWDSIYGFRAEYDASEVDALWEKVGYTYSRSLPMSVNFAPDREFLVSIDTGDLKVAGCSHSWREYFGLSEQYEYCTKCDEKKK